ncbi:TPA: hypothetical protein CPT80_00450 [Candidatus Gastranaerophilales bacterium HUM_9]|nr:MAG TPA: hypothetical protein CPT80_00450 [Candidatus Gastranaerophilales bacterium HUM_9]HBX35515.1 hypothetical protein [Cyanobacteria bacterium UBA11440]
MRHCCTFDAFDIWYLKDNDSFCNRVLYIGFCPHCQKPVLELIQQNKDSHTYSFLKKIGLSANSYAKELIPEKIYARSDVFRRKFATKPFGWKYGINKEIKIGDNVSEIRQYASDFYGNKTLIKKVN